MNITIRNESSDDIDAITALTAAAFEHEEHSSHTESFIINALRRNKQLTVSLVAVENDEIVGHVAISPVRISSGATGWYGLGPSSGVLSSTVAERRLSRGQRAVSNSL